MAGTLTVLYYDDTDATESNWEWVELKNREVNPSYDDSNPISDSNLPYAYTGGSPVLSCDIKDEIGLPLECNLVLNNSQIVKKPYEIDTNHPLAFASKPLANGQVNQYVGVIPELARIIVHDSSNFMTLFIGRVYRVEEPFVATFGTTLKLRCFDALRELVDISIKDLPSDDREFEVRVLGETNVEGNSSSGTVANGPGNYPTTTTISRWLDHIKDLILKGSYGTSTTQSITYTDHKISNGETGFLRAFKPEEVNEVTTGKYENNDTDILKQIQDFSQREKWEDPSNAALKGTGFDFFLDATRATPIHSLATVPQQDFTYFRRGLYPTSTPATYGLTAKYATHTNVNDNQSTEDDKVRNMFNDFNFAGYASDTITHLTLEYKGRNERPAKGVVDNDANFERYGYGNKRGRVGNTSDKYAGVLLEELGSSPTEVFTLIYVKPISPATELPDFRWQHNRFCGDEDLTDAAKITPVEADPDSDVRTFRQVTSLHKATPSSPPPAGAFPQVDSNGHHNREIPQQGFTSSARQYFLDGGVNKTWVGNIQYQGKTEEGKHFIILSSPQEDVLATLEEDDTLYERGWAKAGDEHDGDKDSSGNQTRHANYTPVYGNCLFESYPSADLNVKKYAHMKAKETTIAANRLYQIYRQDVAARLVGGNTKQERMRNGQFRIKDWPHVRWTGQTQSGVTGNSFKPEIASLKSPLDYGMRRGCSVVKRNSNGFWAGYITDINTSTDAVTAPLFEVVDLGTSAETTPAGAGGWAVDDTYNVYVPYRTGMAIRVDNSMAVTVGDHLITSINYSWNNGHVSSEITTVGINDKVMYKTAAKLRTEQAPNLIEDAEATSVDRMALAANAYEARGVVWWHNHAYGATPSLAAGNLRDYNTFSWSGGLVKVHGTKSVTAAEYKINPGNTDAALTADFYTSPMEANKQYVLYLDTIHGEQADGTYNIQAAVLSHDDDGYVYSPGFINMAYLTIGTNESAGSKEIKGNFNPDGSLYTVNIPFDGSGSNGMGMVNIQFMNTFTNVLGVDNQVIEASRILQPNSLTSTLLSKGSRAFTSNLSIRPRNNLYNQVLWDGDGSGGAATLTFADDDVVTIAAGNTTSGFSNNTTNYMYLDGTSAGLTGTLTPQFTTAHGTATGDSKVLLALIVVGADATQKSPTILPLNSKVPTFNATAIAADAIVATHVQAGSIDTAKLSVAAQNSITEKAITHVGNSAPSNPRTNDIWFDTSVNPTVIKVWDGSAWTIRNNNAPSGGGATVFYAATSSPPTSAAVNDIWYATDTDIAYIAVTHPANSIETSTEWVKQDVVTAINSASTEINGGLINTAKIILTAGGANILETGTGSSPNAARIELSNTEIAGYSSSGESNKQFNIKASDGKAYFLGGAATVETTGVNVYSNADQTLRRSRLSTTGGVQLGSGLATGIWFDDAGESSSKHSYIQNVGSGSNTYGSGDVFGIYSLKNDIVLQSTTQDIGLFPDTTTGRVVIGDRPLVFLDETGTGSRHSADYTGIWRQSGTLSASNVYLLPTTTSSSAIAGKVLGVVGNATGSGSVASPYYWNLGWVDNTGGSGGEANENSWKYINVSGQTQVVADNDADTLTFVAGSNMTITTSGDTITFASSGGSGGGISSSDDVTWTGTHNFTSTVTLGNQGSDLITVIGDMNISTKPLRLKRDGGTGSSLALARTNSTSNGNDDTGFYFYTSGDYEGWQWRAKGRHIITGSSSWTGSSGYDYFVSDAHLDMNSNIIYDVEEIRLENGTAANPPYTFTDDDNTGMYRYGVDRVALTGNGQPCLIAYGNMGGTGVGAVGIGIDTPTHRLHVNGVARSTQSSWATSSDGRVKENIIDMEPALDKLLQLKPKRFNFKDSYRADHKDSELGFIGQDIEQIIPETIMTVEESDGKEIIDDFRILDTSPLVPMLVKAVQELKEQNDVLLTRIEALEGD